MESTEREYYQALFRRDFAAARRLYRVLCCADVWPADHVQREGHKCGIFDEASYDDSWENVTVLRRDAVEMELLAAG
jgi:hypothetical protein